MSSEVLPNWIRLNHTEKSLNAASSGWLGFVVENSHDALNVKHRKDVIKKVLEKVSGYKCLSINTSNRSSKAKRKSASVQNKLCIVYAKFGDNCEAVYQKVKAE